MTKEPPRRYALKHINQVKYISNFSTATGFPSYTLDISKARTYTKEVALEIISRHPNHREIPYDE